ncbi:hypothetical protein Scep_016041 [Stephania cephalantha]|uniref:AAA+ ATPase domain-containing protein n=1 Tax=Stephania cephalantha TaxID=152367 RepID=A0AAP0IN23_9MAGN
MTIDHYAHLSNFVITPIPFRAILPVDFDSTGAFVENPSIPATEFDSFSGVISINRLAASMEFVGPAIDLVRHLWSCSGDHISHLFNLEENLESLRNSTEELKNLRDEVKAKVASAQAQSMACRPVVQGWLQRVEGIEAEIRELLQRGSRLTEEGCMKGFCCSKNCWTNHKLGKKVAKRLNDVNDLKSKACEFDEVADRHNVVSVQAMPDSPAVGMEPLLNKAMKLLADDEIDILGIYGMGGVGKTTLLHKMNNELLNLGANHEVVVIMVVVSTKNLSTIQHEIGERLGWKSQAQDQRDDGVVDQHLTLYIFNILSSKKLVLLLDDCWNRVDLKKIGIQVGSKCKVVFTTRSDVVCGEMEAKEKIKVECLDSDKAWSLFKEKVGERALSLDPEIPDLAEMVARECGGLPLALIATGRAMASKKTPQEWRHALTLLRKSTSEFSDHSIRNDEIIRHWIGEGFLDGFENLNEAYDKGCSIIGILIDVCLLESGAHRNITVKMHDVIRDMAIWIGNGCCERVDKNLVKSGAHLSEATITEKWSEAQRISLMHNDIELLKDASTTCTNLITLLLQHNQTLRNLSDTFFQFMPALKVLNLSSTSIEHLPKSITHLVELRFLDLSHSRIKQLPGELKNLVKLRYLNLFGMNFLEMIPQRVLSSLSNLQILNIREGCYRNWRVEENEENVQDDGEVSLTELEDLESLSAFELTVYSTVVLHQLLNSKKIRACTTYLEISQCPGLVSLKLESPSSSSSSSSLATISEALTPSRLTQVNLRGMKNLQSLTICDCSLEDLSINFKEVEKETISLFRSLKELRLYDLSDLIITCEKGSTSHQCFQKLDYVYIEDCHALEDLTLVLYLPNLKYLYVDNCWGLETIISNEDRTTIAKMNPFSRLRRLTLTVLPSLHSICEHALPFPSLEVIAVNWSPHLLKLPFDCSSAQSTLRSINGPSDWLEKLQWEDEKIKSQFVPYFNKPYLYP